MAEAEKARAATRKRSTWPALKEKREKIYDEQRYKMTEREDYLRAPIFWFGLWCDVTVGL